MKLLRSRQVQELSESKTPIDIEVVGGKVVHGTIVVFKPLSHTVVVQDARGNRYLAKTAKRKADLPDKPWKARQAKERKKPMKTKPSTKVKVYCPDGEILEFESCKAATAHWGYKNCGFDRLTKLRKFRDYRFEKVPYVAKAKRKTEADL